MTEREKSNIKNLSIRQAITFEELKNEFYETNYAVQNLELSNTEVLRALNAFHKKLNEFERGLLELREKLRKYGSS